MGKHGGHNKKPGSKAVSMRLSSSDRAVLDVISGGKKGGKTAAVSQLAELWLSLAACAEEIPEDSAIARRLKSLQVLEVAKGLRSLQVLGDEDGDCVLCGSFGHDWRVGADSTCLACKGVGDFLEHDENASGKGMNLFIESKAERLEGDEGRIEISLRGRTVTGHFRTSDETEHECLASGLIRTGLFIDDSEVWVEKIALSDEEKALIPRKTMLSEAFFLLLKEGLEDVFDVEEANAVELLQNGDYRLLSSSGGQSEEFTLPLQAFSEDSDLEDVREELLSAFDKAFSEPELKVV